MNYYFLYNTVTGQILGAQLAASSPYAPGTGEAVASFASNDATAALAAVPANWPKFLIQGTPAALVAQPYWELMATQSTTTSGEYTLTSTLNNPPASPPTSATFSVAGGTIMATVSNNQATATIQLHASVASQPVSVQVSASGTISGSTTINSGTAQVGLQLVTSGATPMVAPVGAGSLAFLRQQALGITAENQGAFFILALQNLMVAASMISEIGVNKIIPALTASTYTPITLTSAEQSALTSWQTNVAQYQVALKDLLDTSGNALPGFADVQTQAPQVQTAWNTFNQWAQEIPGLA